MVVNKLIFVFLIFVNYKEVFVLKEGIFFCFWYDFFGCGVNGVGVILLFCVLEIEDEVFYLLFLVLEL